MADKTINDFTAATSLNAGDLFEIENTGNNSRKVATSVVKSHMASWQLVDQSGVATASPTWTWSTNVANVDVTGLANYNELLIFVLGVSTASGTGTRAIAVSVNNGSSFYTGASDYTDVALVGTTSNSSFFMNHGTGTASARSIVGHVKNLKGPIKMAEFMSGTHRYFNASSSDINAIRLFDGTAGANLTAGSLYVYAR